MKLTPLSWKVNETSIVINHYTIGDKEGFMATMYKEWPMSNLYLAFNDEDYFWFSDTHGDRNLTPHCFDDNWTAAEVALETK